MSPLSRRRLLALALAAGAPIARAQAPNRTDPFASLQWPDLQREFFPGPDVAFDDRVQVRGPAFAEDPMNVPISVSTAGIADIERVVVIVDRNPIRKVLEVQPLVPTAGFAFRFKLEQASPVRAGVRLRDGRWLVGGTLVDSAGGGCTVAGATRADGSWSSTLGRVGGGVFPSSTPAAASRVRLQVMHPMDTGLVGGIPAFFVNRLALRDAHGRELLRVASFEPVSENPVFSFDFVEAPPGPLRLSGSDNNGNRIDAALGARGGS